MSIFLTITNGACVSVSFNRIVLLILHNYNKIWSILVIDLSCKLTDLGSNLCLLNLVVLIICLHLLSIEHDFLSEV